MGKKEFKGSIGLFIVLVIIFWPAAIIYFFLKYKEVETESKRICPSCGSNVPLDAKVCPYCGKKILSLILCI